METDWRKAVDSHGSPDKLSTQCFNKSPMTVNGRLEQFGDSKNMILKWKEEEVSITENSKGGRGVRRRSQRIDELCGLFEPGGDSLQLNLDTDAGRGEGEIKFVQMRRISKIWGRN